MNANAKPKEFDNGLKLIPIHSIVTPEKPPGILSETEAGDLAPFTKDKFGVESGLAVFYLDYGIRFAKWEQGKFVFHDGQEAQPQYLQLARVFNEERELKIWRVDEAFYYRLRRDDENGEGGFAVDAEQNLWGTKISHESNGKKLPDKWTRLWEDRGTEVIVPIPVAVIDVKYGKDKAYKGELACLKTRNYIGAMENGQATYVDCRFVSLRERTVAEVK